MAKISITLHALKQTKNTVVFEENLPEGDFLASPKMGNVYVPKGTLREMGYTGGDLKFTIETAAA